MNRFLAMSDQELRIRLELINAQLEAAGVNVPHSLNRLPWGEQQAWMERTRAELGE